MEMIKRKCFVRRDNLTDSDIQKIVDQQGYSHKHNSRSGEDAFSKALRGSKRFLKAHGYIEDKEEQ